MVSPISRMVTNHPKDGHPPSQIYTLIDSVNFIKYQSSLTQFNIAVQLSWPGLSPSSAQLVPLSEYWLFSSNELLTSRIIGVLPVPAKVKSAVIGRENVWEKWIFVLNATMDLYIPSSNMETRGYQKMLTIGQILKSICSFMKFHSLNNYW